MYIRSKYIQFNVSYASCIHIPIQTHTHTTHIQMMVWAPGGYKFSDFTKAGFGVKIIHTLVCVFLAAQFWSFDEKIDWKGVKV